MKARRLHIIWFFHQPFFIPDDEIAWRVDSTYIPLLDALGERSIPCSLGVTASLLERCRTVRPGFINLLSQAVVERRVGLLGTAAYHPVLPWLSNHSARAQMHIDRAVKRQLGLEIVPVFWPTELAWSMNVGALAAEFGYKAVVVDSSSRDAADTMPNWRSGPRGLQPNLELESRVGISAKVQTLPGCRDSDAQLDLWVREHALSTALVEIMVSDEEDEREHVTSFLTVLDEVRQRAVDPEAPVIIAEDPERFLPNGLARFLDFLDGVLKASIEFVPSDSFMALPASQRLAYVPAGTMEGDDAMWSAVLDDVWFRHRLDRVTGLVETRIDLLNPISEEHRDIRDKLLRIQDSGFYFWRYVSRTRLPFHATLLAIEQWLENSA